MSRVAVAVLTAVVLAGCGGAVTPDQPDPAAAPGPESAAPLPPGGPAAYGFDLELPEGWATAMRRGALHLATFALPESDDVWATEARQAMREEDILVVLLEYEQQPSPPLELEAYPAIELPVAVGRDDLQPLDGDFRCCGQFPEGHDVARRLFSAAGRHFDVWVELGERPASDAAIAEANRALAALGVEPGDFYPGRVAAPGFAPVEGWRVGSVGSVPATPQGELATAWASTAPYLDEWNALPPSRTLESLPPDGIVIWVGAWRNPWEPRWPEVPPPYALERFEVSPGWEGQVRDIPEYRLWTQFDGQYEVDVRVYFGGPEPSPEMLAGAQRLLNGLELPDWARPGSA